MHKSCGWLVFNSIFTEIWRYRILDITSYNHKNVQSSTYKYKSVIQLLLVELLLLGLQKCSKEHVSNNNKLSALNKKKQILHHKQ